MGTRFFRDSFFTTSSLRGSAFTCLVALDSAASLACGSGVDPCLDSWGGISFGVDFTSSELIPSPATVCSLLLVGLLPGIDFDLAIIGYSLHSPKVRNELSCSANHIHLIPECLKERLNFWGGGVTVV